MFATHRLQEWNAYLCTYVAHVHTKVMMPISEVAASGWRIYIFPASDYTTHVAVKRVKVSRSGTGYAERNSLATLNILYAGEKKLCVCSNAGHTSMYIQYWQKVLPHFFCLSQTHELLLAHRHPLCRCLPFAAAKGPFRRESAPRTPAAKSSVHLHRLGFAPNQATARRALFIPE